MELLFGWTVQCLEFIMCKEWSQLCEDTKSMLHICFETQATTGWGERLAVCCAPFFYLCLMELGLWTMQGQRSLRFWSWYKLSLFCFCYCIPHNSFICASVGRTVENNICSAQVLCHIADILEGIEYIYISVIFRCFCVFKLVVQLETCFSRSVRTYYTCAVFWESPMVL